MQYNFEQFDPTPYAKSRIIDGLSITGAGRIGLPKHFLTKHRIQRESRAKLYWDAEKRTLAIEFTDKPDPEGRHVNFTQEYGAYINGNPLFKHYQIDLSECRGRHPYTVTNGPDVGIATSAMVFVVDLRKQEAPGQAAQGTRNG